MKVKLDEEERSGEIFVHLEDWFTRMACFTVVILKIKAKTFAPLPTVTPSNNFEKTTSQVMAQF